MHIFIYPNIQCLSIYYRFFNLLAKHGSLAGSAGGSDWTKPISGKGNKPQRVGMKKMTARLGIHHIEVQQLTSGVVDHWLCVNKRLKGAKIWNIMKQVKVTGNCLKIMNCQNSMRSQGGQPLVEYQRCHNLQKVPLFPMSGKEKNSPLTYQVS